MYLQDGLYDAEHKPRLTYARSYFLGYSDRDPDLKGLEKFYIEWRDYDEYIVVQKQSDNVRVKGEIDKETIAVKCSKRGNDVYWWRVGKRIKKLYDLREQTTFDPHRNFKSSNVLFVTLTYDVKQSSIVEAWETEGKDFNNWIRNLRKKFGRISYFRSLEASKKGYPHIHILMISMTTISKLLRLERNTGFERRKRLKGHGTASLTFKQLDDSEKA